MTALEFGGFCLSRHHPQHAAAIGEDQINLMMRMTASRCSALWGFCLAQLAGGEAPPARRHPGDLLCLALPPPERPKGAAW